MSIALKRLLVPLAFLAAVLVQLLITQQAFAATVTWDGGGADDNFSTGLNWVGDVAPVAGDDLVFDTDGMTDGTFNNDLIAGTQFNSLTFSGLGSGTFTLTGNSFDLAGDITNDMTYNYGVLSVEVDIALTSNSGIIANGLVHLGASDGSNTLDLGSYTLSKSGSNPLYLNSVVSGTGGLTFSAGSTLIESGNAFDGDVNVGASGTVYINDPAALGSTTGKTIISGGTLAIATVKTTFTTLGEDIDLNGTLNVLQGPVTFGGKGGSSGWTTPELYGYDVTLSGTVTLTANSSLITSSLFYGNKVTLSDFVPGAFTLSRADGSGGDLYFGTAKQAEAAHYESTYSSENSNSWGVYPGTKALVEAALGDATVMGGGILGGTGSVGVLNVLSGGTLAPGLSPGCLSSGNLTLAGTFEVEIDGGTVCTEYDQQRVTGTVDVSGATLDIVKLASYAPADGTTFTIISNDGEDAVTGTFSGLAEAGSVTVDSVEYFITYQGGDGNDVVLGVGVVPETPNTGFSLIKANVLMVTLMTTLASAALVGIARNLKKGTA